MVSSFVFCSNRYDFDNDGHSNDDCDDCDGVVNEDVVDGGVHEGSNVLEEIVEEHEGNIEETNAGIKHGNFYFIEREIFEVFDIYGIYYF